MRMRGVAIVFLFVCIVASGIGQQTWPRAEFASNQIEAYRKHYDVPGLSIAIAHKGQIVFAKGFGLGDVEHNVPIRTTDYFRLASVSKPITATMIFELIEQGKIDLDAEVRRYLPNLPPHHTYKVRDLLSHQSGIRHYSPADPPLKTYPTSSSALARFVNDPLLFPPGEKYSYSTHAFTVLGALIEKVTKRGYRHYVDERIAAWGLKGIRCESGGNVERTQIYDRAQSKNKLAARDDLSWKFPGGGLEATAIGMCKLGAAIQAGKILKAETLKLMWTVQKPRTGESTMALGWSISNAGQKRAAVHGGSQLGSNSNWRIQIDEEWVVMVLSNRSGHKPGDLATYLARIATLGPNDPLPEIKLN
jgi:serine beta-lactamase-like protein LACTB, mitochondrial